MGTYIPAGEPRKRDISETLLEAEEEHYLDCPNADFFIRVAAVLLDAIFLYLIYSALQRLRKVGLGYLVLDPNNPEIPITGSAAGLIYFINALQVGSLYLYFIWTLVTFGGSPGKLCLGLRVIQSETGKHLGYGRALMREMVGKPTSVLLAGIGLVLPLVRRDRRALHDLLSRTVVKRVQGEI